MSDDIIPKILDCPGLIYLTGGASGRSFWVSFERDYGLRANRKVFSYNPNRGSFQRDASSPLPLDVEVIFHISDQERVEKLLSWMETERHFKIARGRLRSSRGGFTGDIIINNLLSKLRTARGEEQDGMRAAFDFIESFFSPRTLILPGHGKLTLLEVELAYNPTINRLRGLAV